MKTISVIGSCACRDLFEKDNGENFSFHTDFRFMSPISMLSSPVDFIHADYDSFVKDVKVVNGKWYRKNLLNDINKTAFKALHENHGEFLVLDFAESRISLAEISWPNKEDKLLVSYSTSFRAHYCASFNKNIFKNASINTKNPLEFTDEEWKNTIETFVKQIKSVFDDKKIILIENMPAKYFLDRFGFLKPYFSQDHIESIMLCEILLPRIYQFFVDSCPNAKIIKIPPYALGSQIHKWGNHPFHFTERYYEYLLKCVRAITLDKSQEKLLELYNEYAKKFMDDFNSAKYKTALNKKEVSTFSLIDYLKNYEEFNVLGKKKKTMILFALDKRNFIKNIRKIVKEDRNG